MHQFTFHDPRNALYSMCRIFLQEDVYSPVERVAPRGQETRELRNVTMTIRDTTNCLALDMNRRFNARLAAVEALSLVGGFADADLLTAASPRYLEFTGGALTGAYGPRLYDQLPIIVETLRADPDSRQAVANIWDFETDLEIKHGDRPCTVYISFLIRDHRLITSTYMRSQDIYLGWTYDAVMFSTLHQTMANVLGVRAGDLVHTVQSLHLYERDVFKAEQLMPPELNSRVQLHGLQGSTWDEVQDRARLLVYENGPLRTTSVTEAWFREQINHTPSGDAVTETIRG